MAKKKCILMKNIFLFYNSFWLDNLFNFRYTFFHYDIIKFIPVEILVTIFTKKLEIL